MGEEERQEIKRKCGGSWKLVLKFLLAGEFSCRREKSKALAGPGHSIAMTSKGIVYSFGFNGSGQLGQGTTQDSWQPQPIRLLISLMIQFGQKSLSSLEVHCVADHFMGFGSFRQLLALIEQF